MTRADWMDAQAEAPPFGSLLTVRSDHAVRYHTTSGTTGRTPLRVLDGTKDWEWIAEMWAYGLWGFGLRPNDVVLFAFSYGTFIGFWGAHYACEKIGCLVLSTGSATTESRVQAASSTWASRPSARRRPMRCGCGRRPPRWASTSPATARSTR